MKTKLLRFLGLIWVLNSFALGHPAPSIGNFTDPLFYTFSHQQVDILPPSEYKVGKENIILLRLEKPDLPSGYRVSVLLDVLKSPSSSSPPKMQGWYPKTTIIPTVKGEYIIGVHVNLIYKSS